MYIDRYDQELSYLYNAATLADDLAEFENADKTIDASQILPMWRRARWERCASAILMTGDPQREDITVEDAIIHALIALKMLDVPMPWSEEYKKGSSALKKFVDKLSGKRRGYRPLGNTLGGFTGCREAFIGLKYGEFAALEVCSGDGVAVEDCERVAALCMLALTLPALAESLDTKSLGYLSWLCGYLAGGGDRIKRGSTLQAVKKRAQDLLRKAEKKAKDEIWLLESFEAAVNREREQGPFRSAFQSAKDAAAKATASNNNNNPPR